FIRLRQAGPGESCETCNKQSDFLRLHIGLLECPLHNGSSHRFISRAGPLRKRSIRCVYERGGDDELSGQLRSRVDPRTVEPHIAVGSTFFGTPHAPSSPNKAPIVLEPCVKQRMPRSPLFQGLRRKWRTNRAARARGLAASGSKLSPKSSRSVAFAPGLSRLI